MLAVNPFRAEPSPKLFFSVSHPTSFCKISCHLAAVKFGKDLFRYFKSTCVSGVGMCMCRCLRRSGVRCSLELDFQAVVSHPTRMEGAELRSSARTVHTPNL